MSVVEHYSESSVVSSLGKPICSLSTEQNFALPTALCKGQKGWYWSGYREDKNVENIVILGWLMKSKKACKVLKRRLGYGCYPREHIRKRICSFSLSTALSSREWNAQSIITLGISFIVVSITE